MENVESIKDKIEKGVLQLAESEDEELETVGLGEMFEYAEELFNDGVINYQLRYTPESDETEDYVEAWVAFYLNKKYYEVIFFCETLEVFSSEDIITHLQAIQDQYEILMNDSKAPFFEAIIAEEMRHLDEQNKPEESIEEGDKPEGE